MKFEETISPSSQRYARCEKFIKGMASADDGFIIYGIVPLDKSFATSSLAAYR
jgi:hypothetical protein